MDGEPLLQTWSQEIGWARELIDLANSYRAARVVQVASGAGLFAQLGQGAATTAAVAAALSLDAAVVEEVLIACAALDLVRRKGDGWALTPKARATLLPDAPRYQGHTLAHAADVWHGWDALPARLRGRQDSAGSAAGGYDEEREAERRWHHRDFILAMHNMAMAGRAAEVAARVDLAGKRTLLDVGGGPGTYSVALCRRYPDLRATVFDLPETLAITREVVEGLGMSDRVRTQPGNWNEDEFGTGNDAVLLSSVLHGAGSQAEMKLAKAYRSMTPRGVLILQDFLLNAEKTGPLKPALFNIMVGAFSVDELAARVAAAGFTSVETQPLPDDLGSTLVTAVKPS